MRDLSFRGHVTTDRNETLDESVRNAVFATRESLRVLPKLRDEYLERDGIDREFVAPDSNWKSFHYSRWDGWKRLAFGDWDYVKYLRLFATMFSSYNLGKMSFAVEGVETLETIPDNFDAEFVSQNPEPDEYARLWLDLIRDMPESDVYRAPWKFGEIGFDFDGYVVNYDVAAYQERMKLMQISEVFKLLDWRSSQGKIPVILEIGSGYGALSYALCQRFPNSITMLCDLPESLMYSGVYLSGCVTDRPINVLKSFDDISGIDLSKRQINIAAELSFL